MFVVFEIKPVFNEDLANVETFFQWLKHSNFLSCDFRFADVKLTRKVIFAYLP